jgi:hypothetical protein
MTRFHFREVFHAVGHGLFAAGVLYLGRPRTCFYWVFDCGSRSKHNYLERELHLFATMLNGESIRLFCISHFDEDHINGARHLLEKHRVDTLILPYFPLVERIQIAVSMSRISADYLQFLVDPAGYLFGIAGDNLGQIIFIMGGGNPTNDAESPEPQRYSADNFNLNIPNAEEPDEPLAGDPDGVSDPATSEKVFLLSHSKPVTVGSVWEFVFFNEHSPEDRLRPLREAVISILKSHANRDGSFRARQMLPELKKLYSEDLGSSGKDKNRISLVSYSGPLLSSGLVGWRSEGYITDAPNSYRWHDWNRPHLITHKFSTLHTGDFLLTSMPKLLAMRAHFGVVRWSRIVVTQIPHHGSKGAWFDGAATHFEHELSVFSSGRGSTSFPAKTVIDDLQTRTPIFVNEYQRFGLSGHLEVP